MGSLLLDTRSFKASEAELRDAQRCARKKHRKTGRGVRKLSRGGLHPLQKTVLQLLMGNHAEAIHLGNVHICETVSKVQCG
jgi:hypothetical protein